MFTRGDGVRIKQETLPVQRRFSGSDWKSISMLPFRCSGDVHRGAFSAESIDGSRESFEEACRAQREILRSEIEPSVPSRQLP